MTDGVFIDTNVLVYWAGSPGLRRAQARGIFDAGAASGRIWLSGQVIGEFANVTTGKLGLPTADVNDAIERFENDASIFPLIPAVTRLALTIRDRHGLAFYDAQIWAAAALAGCSVLLSEDFTDGIELLGVRCRNPFAEGFDPESVFA